jgi:hypothetical protein
LGISSVHAVILRQYHSFYFSNYWVTLCSIRPLLVLRIIPTC